MSLRELARRLSVLLRRDRYVDDLESEMRLHREYRAARLQREGLSPAEAAHAAERQFGNKTLLKEVSVNMWSWIWLDDLMKDIRHTCRMLAGNPLTMSTARIMSLTCRPSRPCSISSASLSSVRAEKTRLNSVAARV